MTKDIKDYLHLYLGCEVQLRHNGTFVPDPYEPTCYLSRITDGRMDSVGVRYDGSEEIIYPFTADIKPILRPLSDMTEEEARQLCPNGEEPFLKYLSEKDEWYTNRIHFYTAYSECYRFLLSRGFDLFGLIDSGLAIDATKIQKV